MIVVLTILNAAPGHEDEWRQIWHQERVQITKNPGFRGVRMLHDIQQVRRYVVLSEWDERADHAAAIRSTGFLWLEDALAFLERSPTWLYLEESGSVRGQPPS